MSAHQSFEDLLFEDVSRPDQDETLQKLLAETDKRINQLFPRRQSRGGPEDDGSGYGTVGATDESSSQLQQDAE